MRAARILSVAAVATLAAGVVVPLSAQAAVSPRAPFTALTLEGNKGSYIWGEGPGVVFAGTQVSTNASANGFSIGGTNGTSSVGVNVTAPTDGTLAKGTYSTARFAGPGTAGMDISADSRGCNESIGTLTIHEIGRDSADTITSIAASYTYSCDGMPRNAGEIRWESTIDYVRFGQVKFSTTAPVQTVTVTAPADGTTFGTASLVGDEPKAFWVAPGSDTCSGRQLAGGATCTVGLQAMPYKAGPVQATLVLPDAAHGDRAVPLNVSGIETAAGSYTARPPARVLDTRTGNGTGGVKTPLSSGRTLTVQIAGRGGLPKGGVTAAVLNLTVTGSTRAGYLTAYPTGAPRPTASNINYAKGWTGANLVTVPLGTDGKVSIYASGTTHVIADVMGFYRSDTPNLPQEGTYGSFQRPATPTRELDTRTDGGRLPGGYYLTMPFDFGDEANAAVRALAVNITVTGPTKPGYLTAWNGNLAELPNTSTLNFLAGTTVPNMAVVPVTWCYDCTDDGRPVPSIGILNESAGSAHVIVDYFGVYDDNRWGDGLRFRSVGAPKRVVDTRVGLGASRLGPDTTRTVTNTAAVAGNNTLGFVANTTAILPTENTYLTLWGATEQPRPQVSNVNANRGTVVSNMTLPGAGYANDFRIYNSRGNVDVAVDVAGTLERYPGLPDVFFTQTGAAQRSLAPKVRTVPAPLVAPEHIRRAPAS